MVKKSSWVKKSGFLLNMTILYGCIQIIPKHFPSTLPSFSFLHYSFSAEFSRSLSSMPLWYVEEYVTM